MGVSVAARNVSCSASDKNEISRFNTTNAILLLRTDITVKHQEIFDAQQAVKDSNSRYAGTGD